MSRSSRLGAGMVLLLAGAGVLAWLNLNSQQAPTPTTIDPIPDRFARVIVDTPEAEAPTPTPTPTPAPAPAPEQQPATATAEKADRTVAEQAGVLGALDGGGGSLDGTFGEVGGLIGSKGVQVGAGGLGSRGSGLGGGGTAAGLGGLGTAGRGSGSGSGYGYGSGRQGAAVYGSLSTQGRRPDVASTEQYTDYGVNNVTLTSEDAQSTFSVDVDTASYTIARRKLREGSLPPEAAVRVEEFVNYFDYSYRPPAAGGEEPFSVFMEAAPSPWATDRHILRVGLQGRALDEADRRPARLTFLVDVSGSMGSADKLPLAQKAMRELVGNLGPEDSVAIATYAGRTERILAPTPATRKADIYDAIEALTSGGGTAMSSGVTMAYEMASAAYVDGAENRVIVLSDGDANIGPDSHQQLLSQISGHAKAGITLSTIGFGMGNYKDTMMEQLANKGDGNNFYIDSFAEARRVFGEDLSGTIQTIARDVKIQVEFEPEAVYAYRLIGYENRDIADRDFRNDAVDAGEVGSGHQVTALYELVLADGYRATDALATVRLRAKPPGPDAPAVEWDTTYPTAHVKAELADASADFRLALGGASFAEKLRGSPHTAELSYEQISALIQGTAHAAELDELIRRAAALSAPEALTTTR